MANLPSSSSFPWVVSSSLVKVGEDWILVESFLKLKSRVKHNKASSSFFSLKKQAPLVHLFHMQVFFALVSSPSSSSSFLLRNKFHVLGLVLHGKISILLILHGGMF